MPDKGPTTSLPGVAGTSQRAGKRPIRASGEAGKEGAARRTRARQTTDTTLPGRMADKGRDY